ncbi:hypothetical protein LTR84_000463 [Exophiala bonariae]|uniref:Uncharacterized protein n=1 Tax=Exophiala bonariae TaxID=1690606 RepID=A0AAV9NQN7_9EURO|nr:hypothetical protein LTR84_000463 [Exophiala bonariae]
MIKAAAKLISQNWSRELKIGSMVENGMDLSETVGSCLSGLKIAGKVMSVIGALGEVGTFAADIVLGAKQKEQLQGLIVGAASQRHVMESIYCMVNAAVNFKSRLAGVIAEKRLLTSKIGQPQNRLKPDGDKWTQADVDANVKADIDAFVQDYANASPQPNILGNLALLDSNPGSNSWKNEDPTSDQIQQYIKDHPPLDDAGDDVGVAGEKVQKPVPTELGKGLDPVSDPPKTEVEKCSASSWNATTTTADALDGAAT